MDAKLIAARAEIEDILQRHDVAAHVVLHNAPGNSEVFMRLTPRYSRLVPMGSERDGLEYRLLSKLADYNGDAKAQARDLAATANMVHSIAMALGQDAMAMLQLSDFVSSSTGATHGPARRAEGHGAMKAAIAIDAWKLDIFERRLGQAGYAFENAGALTTGTLVLKVSTDNLSALGEVVKAANAEAARTGAPR